MRGDAVNLYSPLGLCDQKADGNLATKRAAVIVGDGNAVRF